MTLDRTLFYAWCSVAKRDSEKTRMVIVRFARNTEIFKLTSYRDKLYYCEIKT